MSKTAEKSGVYTATRGFYYEVSRFFAFLLLVVMTVLPLAPLYAADEVATQTVTENELSSQDLSANQEPVSHNEVTNSDDIALPSEETEVGSVESGESPASMSVEEITPQTGAEADSSSESFPVDDIPESNSGTSTADETVLETVATEGEQVTDTEGSEIISEVPVDTDVLVAVDNVSTSSVSEIEGNATSTLPVEDLPLVEEVVVEPEEVVADVLVATTTEVAEIENEETVPGSIAVNTILNDDNKFMFSKDECVSVGDGSFYCSNASTSPKSIGMDRVFSAPDSGGDLEIFVERDGSVAQISNNNFDDDAPFYDEVSNTLVWHRLMDGRYQIIAYDVETETEVQLTNERQNSMEPSRYDDITAWQSWVGNDWEIMLDEEGALTMLTDNTWHDVSPRINGNYIVWQSFEGGAWRVKVYDRTTKQIDTIENADGAAVDNPRFVLVYDATHDNGDKETKGYDLKSKTVVPLSATPTPLPESLPDPEQTGEDRALIQATSQLKPKEEVTTEPEPQPVNDPVVPIPESQATSTFDIVVPPLDSGNQIESETTSSMAGEATSSDLVIEPHDTHDTASSTAHIEDVIVTPYVEPIVVPADSQNTVASST